MSKKATAPHPLAEALAQVIADADDMPKSAKQLLKAILETLLATTEDIAAIRAKLGA